MKFYVVYFGIIMLLLFNVNAIGQENYLDNTFGTGGIVTSGYFQARALALQGDGKILVGGSASDDAVLYRFLPDGTPDLTFGEDGKATVVANDYHSLFVTDVVQLTNGDILAIGNSTSPGFQYPFRRMFFVRFNAEGVAYESGISYRDFGTANPNSPPQGQAMASKIILLPDGKIMVSGARLMPGIMPNPSPALARFNADLSPDTTFNNTGYRVMNGLGAFSTMAIYNNGKIVAPVTGNGNTMKIYRFEPTGELDSSFGTNGTASISHGGSQGVSNDISIIGEEKLLISGSVNNNVHSAIVVRTLPNGTLDDTFGISGIFTIENNSGHSEKVYKSFVLPTGDIVAGVLRWTNTYNFGLVFLTADGGLDFEMGDQSQVFTPVGEEVLFGKFITQSDGKILAMGHDWGSAYLIRYAVPSMLGGEIFTEPKISIYPNPASGKIMVNGLAEKTYASLFSLSGQKILDVTLESDVPVDISGLAEGVYFLKASNFAVKLIKQ